MNKYIITIILFMGFVVGQTNYNTNSVKIEHEYQPIKFIRNQSIIVPFDGYFLPTKLTLHYINAGKTLSALQLKYESILTENQKLNGRIYELDFQLKMKNSYIEMVEKENEVLNKMQRTWQLSRKYEKLIRVGIFTTAILGTFTAIYAGIKTSQLYRK